MSAEELREQAIDFAYGNGHFEDERVTREGVARAAAELNLLGGKSKASQ